jgi:hypothetical protein
MENNNEQIVAKLIQAGITCRSCWWQEGGRCYVEPCEREDPSPDVFGCRSKRMADKVCHEHTNKRSVLASVIPNDMLVIASELNGKK